MILKFVAFGILLLTFSFFIHVYIINILADIYQRKEKIIPKKLYYEIIKYSLIYISIYIFSWVISTSLYTIIYFLGFTYIGLILNIAMFCALYQILIKLIILSPFYSKILTIFIPILITIYSLIKAQILYFQEETLIYEGYHDNIKILHISDMHLGAIYQKNSVEKLANIINQQYPDVVVITGDISDGSATVNSNWLQPFNKVSDNIQVLYITGNHENLYGKKDIINEISKIKKIKYIGNSNDIVQIKGINFIGVDYEYKDGIKRAKNIIRQNRIENGINVLLYHIPNISLKDLYDAGIFLMMAGHTHGGQIFPFTVLAWLGNKYFTGLYNNDNKNYVFVSSGYGTALTPMRFFSKKMIGIINIKGRN